MCPRERWIALAGLVVLSAPGCLPATPPAVYLGHVANLSADNRAGKHAEQGISLTLKQLTDKGLVEALHGRELKVRHTDTRCELDAYASQAVRLVNVNRVIGLIGGRTSEEIAGLDRVSVPLVSPAGLRPAGASDMVFAIGMRPAQQAFVLAKALPENVRDVAVVADERRDDFVRVADAFGRQLTELREAQKKPIAVLPLRYGKDAKWDELAQAIAKRKSLGAVVFAGAARDWQDLRRRQTLSVPLVFAGDDADTVTLQGGTSKEIIYLATVFAADKDAPRAQAFRQQYRDAFQEEPSAAAALASDALALYVEALKQVAPNFTADKLQAALRELKEFPGLVGTLAIKEQVVARPLYVVRVDGAAREVIQRYGPEALP
jgi:ABC-type branched-subunit amino acid transport system substrate-binding protein